MNELHALPPLLHIRKKIHAANHKKTDIRARRNLKEDEGHEHAHTKI